jgi:hypothetical protein
VIHVPFDPEHLRGEQRSWWEEWSQRAEAATREALEWTPEQGKLKLKASVWRPAREWLFKNVFAEKCAYCEAKVPHVSPGAAEHWRPKLAVSVCDEDGKRKRIERDGVPHPGYYWLAYHWRNLVPVCPDCNSGKGKDTQFPIEGEYVFGPDECLGLEDLDKREKPLLLHPFHGGSRDPRLHLAFDEHGMPHPRKGSKHGVASIAVFHLDREALNDERRQRYEDVREFLYNAIDEAVKHNKTVEECMRKYYASDAVYSLAVRNYVADFVRWLESKLAKDPAGDSQWEGLWREGEDETPGGC